jgi:hypothetical protein
MYREPPSPPNGAPPSDFLYPVVDRARRSVTGVAAIQALLLPLIAGAALAALATPTAGLAGFLGGAVVAVVWWRSGKNGGVVLRVEGDELLVLAAGSKKRSQKPRARLRLADLTDVTLDTKTIRPTMEGDSPIPGLRFVNSQPLPEVDQTRIVLVGKTGEVPLTEAYLPNVDVTEWFGKTRVFLRKHGWLPESERGDD